MPTVKISGMRCGHCTASVSKALTAIDGITQVEVNLEQGEARYAERKPVPVETIRAAIAKIGFEVG